MKELVSNDTHVTPMLFPYEPEQFWQSLRRIVREEISSIEKQNPVPSRYETPGLTYKPLYRIAEICTLFHVTKPTIYDWVKHKKLNPIKVRSRVYFLWQDIQQLLKTEPQAGK